MRATVRERVFAIVDLWGGQFCREDADADADAHGVGPARSWQLGGRRTSRNSTRRSLRNEKPGQYIDD
jgi:hypothetical protein